MAEPRRGDAPYECAISAAPGCDDAVHFRYVIPPSPVHLRNVIVSAVVEGVATVWIRFSARSSRTGSARGSKRRLKLQRATDSSPRMVAPRFGTALHERPPVHVAAGASMLVCPGPSQTGSAVAGDLGALHVRICQATVSVFKSADAPQSKNSRRAPRVLHLRGGGIRPQGEVRAISLWLATAELLRTRVSSVVRSMRSLIITRFSRRKSLSASLLLFFLGRALKARRAPFVTTCRDR